MSMKWMRVRYHYIIATFELKTETTSSAEAATCRVMVWFSVAPLWPPTTYKACQTPFICMKLIWYEYEVDGRSQSYPTACPQWEPHSKSYDWPPFLEWWYGMVLHPYSHPPHIKHDKHLLYVWSRSGRSMTWMGGCNHILHHVPSENPTQYPTTQPTPFRVMVWYGAASLWPLDTVEGAETHYICMK
jgi:hypothetical protein